MSCFFSRSFPLPILCFGISLIVFSSCSRNDCAESISAQSAQDPLLFKELTASSREDTSMLVLKNTIAAIEKEKELVAVGLVESSFFEDKKIHEAFRYFKKMDLDTARKLSLYVIDCFLQTCKGNERVQKFLEEPISLANIEIEIYTENGNLERSFLPEENEISFIQFRDGKLLYQTCDPASFCLKVVCEETYQECAEKVSAGF